MKATTVKTSDPEVLLVQPDIERDAALGVQWLEGELGRDTLQMMGVVDSENKPSTLQLERNRVGEFITRKDQLNWMIEFSNKVIGAIWVDLESTKYLPGPSIHIMIGDPKARGKGVGKVSVIAVIDYLTKSGIKDFYSRHLIANVASSRLLSDIGFINLGDPYKDDDGLTWQNVSFSIG
jgi:RimJ/RimL family protein N-acetyltransferase